MKRDESKAESTRESLFGKLYLVGVFVVLAGTVIYFATHPSIASSAEMSRGAEVAETASVSIVGLVYTLVLWVGIPVVLLVRFLRQVPAPRTSPRLIGGEPPLPVVHAKKSRPDGAPATSEGLEPSTRD